LRNPEGVPGAIFTEKRFWKSDLPLSPQDLIEYFGRERLGLTEKVVDNTLEGFSKLKSDWLRMISVSFLSREIEDKYSKLMNTRFEKKALCTLHYSTTHLSRMPASPFLWPSG
jgi:hypothetical protein